jgi:hypothetical protein
MRIESEGGDTDRSGHEESAKEKAAKTAAKPEKYENRRASGETEAGLETGTVGIATHHQQSADRTELHHRHITEHHEQFHKHEREHLLRATGNHTESHEEMAARHNKERQSMHTRHERENREVSASQSGPSGGIEEKPEGKGGEEEKT